jgi:hypothetical protein
MLRLDKCKLFECTMKNKRIFGCWIIVIEKNKLGNIYGGMEEEKEIQLLNVCFDCQKLMNLV